MPDGEAVVEPARRAEWAHEWQNVGHVGHC